MAYHPSAKKRTRQNEKRRVRNQAVKTRLKTVTKKLRAAVESKDTEQLPRLVTEVNSEFARAASKGVIHKKTAARRVARLSKHAQSVLSA